MTKTHTPPRTPVGPAHRRPWLLLLPLALSLATTAAAAPVSYMRDIRPIVDRKCLVCHACYDAPCQLKMEDEEGLDRGASKVAVYDGSRLQDVVPTRLWFDAESTEEWREKGFVSVTERRLSSLMARMLELGRKNGLEEGQRIPDSIDISPNRANTCPTLDEFEKYAHENPQEGMPLAVTGLTQEEYDTVMTWLDEGATYDVPPPHLGPGEAAHVAMWEEFLNREGMRERLVARYLYEHLYLGHLHFEGGAPGRFFEVVRSHTPPGRPVRIVEAVRPNSPPQGDFFYRLRPIKGTLVHKTHITYALSPEKLERIRSLFLGGDWQVDALPDYSEEAASNPFRTFAAIPAESRYRFLLDDALFFVRTFIRGPVCRGQIATDVIDDHFYALFQHPDHDVFLHDSEYARSQYDDLAIPGRRAGNGRWGPTKWLSAEQAYTRRRGEAYRRRGPTRMDEIWDGEGTNPDALLTIFRHHDSASVNRGLLGEMPKTLWLIDYPIFERIYYQLVLNFDVFGRVGHQLITRLYFDLLRAESETNFLRFLPRDSRAEMRRSWYRGMVSGLKMRLVYEDVDEVTATEVPHGKGDPRVSFVGELIRRAGRVAGPHDYLNRCASKPCADPAADATRRGVEGALQRLVNHSAREARYIGFLPDVTMIRVIVDGGEGDLPYTLIRNRAHRNVAFMLRESARFEPEKDRVTLAREPLGSYPNFVFAVPWQEVEAFVTELLRVRNEAGFTRIVEGFGVRRMSPDFWEHFHFFHEWMQRNDPLEAGVHDMNRYANL